MERGFHMKKLIYFLCLVTMLNVRASGGEARDARSAGGPSRDGQRLEGEQAYSILGRSRNLVTRYRQAWRQLQNEQNPYAHHTREENLAIYRQIEDDQQELDNNVRRLNEGLSPAYREAAALSRTSEIGNFSRWLRRFIAYQADPDNNELPALPQRRGAPHFGNVYAENLRNEFARTVRRYAPYKKRDLSKPPRDLQGPRKYHDDSDDDGAIC